MKTNVYFFDLKMEMVLPIFFGCMTALFLCVMVWAHRLILTSPQTVNIQSADAAEFPSGIPEETSAEAIFRFFTAAAETDRNQITELYQDSKSRPWVRDFFIDICGSQEIADAILSGAADFAIPPSLAFALCWEESRFKPLAVNAKNRDGSIDRGLFQLNSKSFPLLKQTDFFNIKLNARYGMGHLRHCLDTGGTEIAALAMYNAGTGKVRDQGTPKVTLDYIHRILQNRNKIEERFRTQYTQKLFTDTLIVEAPAEPVRFALLSPLRGK